MNKKRNRCLPLVLPVWEIIFLMMSMIFFSGCRKEIREYPFVENYYIGKWDFDEVFHINSQGNRTNSTEVSGSVHFKTGPKNAMYYNGNFSVSFKQPGAAVAESYQGKIKWRVDGALIVQVEDAEDPLYPALGVGKGSVANFAINTKMFKDDFIELTTSADPTHVYAKWNGILLRRK